MDILNLIKEFPDQESCLRFIEEKRWKHGVCCIHCGSEKVGRKNKRKIANGWNCYDCGSSFSATAGTIFHGTRIPLQKWFLAISMLSNAKKSISSYQLARDLDMNQKSAWYMAMRIREKMSDNDELLKGIVEADETYVGGKPRAKSKRGRGTNKSPVIGVVERRGRVVAKFMRVLSGENIREFILSNPDESILMTDEFRSYTRFRLHFKIGPILIHLRQNVGQPQGVPLHWVNFRRGWVSQPVGRGDLAPTIRCISANFRCLPDKCQQNLVWTKILKDMLSITKKDMFLRTASLTPTPSSRFGLVSRGRFTERTITTARNGCPCISWSLAGNTITENMMRFS